MTTPRISRRTFAQGAASLATALTLPTKAIAEQSAPTPAATAQLHFPQGFLWGSATASYQVEGAVKEDGRGTTVWDTFAHTEGKIHNNDNGDTSTDSYHRYAEDIALMKALGLKTCRFSIAWSRIFPDGAGTANQKGIDHYRKFCEALRAAGIQPYCTLYHWDLPQALQDKGGWQNHDTAKLFADYAGYTAGKLADLCSHFMTMNEISTFVDLGYGNGVHAPGLKLARGPLAQVRHHAVLGHGLGLQAIRAAAPTAKVGSAENLQAIMPVYDSPEHVEAAKKAFLEQNAGYLTVTSLGRYTDHYLESLGPDAPKFTLEELKIIGAPQDFQGLNIYTGSYARAVNNQQGFDIVGNPASYPHMASEWINIAPDALYWAPRFTQELFHAKEIYITENGCSSADVVGGDGHVYDTDRIMYLRNYLTHLHRATAEGIPVRGYFLWSLLDNFEWADGYSKRFGITYVDFATQKRTPKLSSDFYKNVIAKNAL